MEAKYERILRLLDNQIQNLIEIINNYNDFNLRTTKHEYENYLEVKTQAFNKVRKRLLTL